MHEYHECIQLSLYVCMPIAIAMSMHTYSESEDGSYMGVQRTRQSTCLQSYCEGKRQIQWEISDLKINPKVSVGVITYTVLLKQNAIECIVLLMQATNICIQQTESVYFIARKQQQQTVIT